MIRKSTLTTFDKWEKPTEAEKREMYNKCFTGSNLHQFADMLDVNYATLIRWRKKDIPYIVWALLANMCGEGDIINKEDTVEGLEKKIQAARNSITKYRLKLSEIQKRDKLKSVIEEAKNSNL